MGVSEQVVVGAGSFTDMLRDVEAAEGRPLVVAPATRPDIVLGVGAAQARLHSDALSLL